MPAALKIPSIFTAIDKFSAPVRKMGNSISKFANQSDADIARVERRFDKLRNKSAQIGRKAAFVGLAIAGSLGVMAKSATDFESKMSNVSTLIDTNTESMADMSAQVLGISQRVPVALDDLTTGLYDVRSAGIAADQAMNVLEQSGVLATAGLSTTAEATNIMTSSMNAFASEGLDAAQVSDILFKTVKFGKTTISELSAGFGASAPIIQSAGVKLADFQAATAALTTVGTPATQAQNQLRAAISKLQKPTTEMEKIFKRLGVTSDKELIQKFGTMGKAFEAVTETGNKMGVNLAKAWGSVEASAAVTSIVGQTNEAYVKTLDAMVNGSNAVTEAFDKQLSTGANQAQIAENNMKALSITVGTSLIPVINQLFQAVTPIIKSMTDWAKQNPETVNTILKVVMAIGVLSMFISGVSFAVSAYSAVMTSYGAIVKAATAVQWLWNAALNANPIGLIIIAITAVIAVVALVIAKWDQWGASVTMLGGIIGAFFSPVLAGFALLISVVMSFRRNWDMIKQSFSEGGIIGGIKAIGVTLLDAVLMPLQQILMIASRLPGKMGALAAQGAAQIENFRTSLGVQVEQPEDTPVANPKKAEQDSFIERFESAETKTSRVVIEDSTGRAKMENETDPGVELESTSFALG